MKCQKCGIVENKKEHKEVNYSALIKAWVCLGCYYRFTRNLFDKDGELKR